MFRLDGITRLALSEVGRCLELLTLRSEKE